MKRFWKKTEGFTLVELIVVIAILGILAGVGTVGYSGYIAKANKAADEVLLRNLNTAFAAACVENGVDAHSLTVSQATVTLDSDGEVSSITPANYQDEFEKYFEGGTFKVIENLIFSQPIAAFIDAGDSVAYRYGSGTIYLSQADVDALKSSTFTAASLGGVSGLLGKVASVSDLAAGLGETSTAFGEFLSSGIEGMAAVMGYNLDDDDQADDFFIVYETMIAEKEAELLAANPSLTNAYELAENQILSNYAILSAAQGTVGKTSADVLTTLKNGFDYATVSAMMKGENTSEGVAQAAMAYSMYTAFAYSEYGSDEARANTDSVDSFLAHVNDSEFTEYLTTKQAETDAAGFLSAMNMVGSSMNDSSAVASVLRNGFGDDKLAELLESAMSN